MRLSVQPDTPLVRYLQSSLGYCYLTSEHRTVYLRQSVNVKSNSTMNLSVSGKMRFNYHTCP